MKHKIIPNLKVKGSDGDLPKIQRGNKNRGSGSG